MSTCVNCNGVGLVSTGANKIDLNHGQKVVCTACNGTGSEVVSSAEISTESESPKAESSSEEAATGESSGEPSGIVPSVGGRCRTENDRPGTLQHDGEKWVCVADDVEV